MEIRAEQVSAEFLQMPENETYLVHSRFEHGVNLQAGNKLCFVGNKHNERLPYGILLGKKELSLLKEHTEEGTSVFVREGGKLCTAEITIELQGAGIYSSRCGISDGKTLTASLSEVFSEVQDECTGFGSSIREMADGRQKELQKLTECFQYSGQKKVKEVLEKWVGLGPGLTPSGDDFLLGILFSDHILPFLGNVFREELQKITDTFHTTAVSVSQYTYAFQHLFCGSLLGFKQAYETEDIQEMKHCIRRLLLFGHTSGRDMTAGLWFGLEQA